MKLWLRKRYWPILVLTACGSDVRGLRDSAVDTAPDVRSEVVHPEPERTVPRYAEPRRSILTNDQVGRLAIPFQENDGQWPDDVAFKADHFAGSLWVTTDGSIVYSLLGPQVEEAPEPESMLGSSLTAPNAVTDPFGLHRAPSSLVEVLDQSTPINVAIEEGAHDPFERHHELPTRGPGWTLVEHFVHGHPRTPRGLDPAVTNVSYFIGNDESKWAPHVATFGALTLGEVWPGIEVRLVARGNNVEKFFHVRPHRDPSLIEMSIEGSEPLRLSEDGALIVTTGNGEVELSPPVAFQVIDAERREVDVRYELVTSDSYRFILGGYDRSHEVVVDPILQSTYLGGSGLEFSDGGVTLDPSGDVLVVGTARSSGYPGTTGGAQASFANGTQDIVISRLSGNLTELRQSTYLGGSGEDVSEGSLLVDTEGRVLVAGSTRSPDYPGTSGGAQSVFGGGSDIVISRLTGSLTSLVQSTYLGGSGDHVAAGLMLDSGGDVLVAGWGSSNYPGTAGGAQASYQGAGDILISRLNGVLTTLIQSTYLGGSGPELTFGAISLEAGGDVVVVGYTASMNYPGTAGGAQPSFGGGSWDAAISRLNSGLTTLIQSTYLGGSGDDFAGGAVLANGELFVSGYTTSQNFPNVGGGAQTNNGGGVADAFVSRLTTNLTSVPQSTYLGGAGQDIVQGSIIVQGDHVWVSGYTSSPNYPGTMGGANGGFAGNPNDFVISRLNTALTSLIQSTYIGGSSSGWSSERVVADSDGNLLIAGWTGQANYPGTAGGAQPSFGGLTDIVVTRLTSDLLGCSSDVDCVTSLGSGVPNPTGGPTFVGRPLCNQLTAQCEPCSDRTYYRDSDGDGYGLTGNTLVQDGCLPVPDGWTILAEDCNDALPNLNPGQPEVCFNGLDEDCDTVADDGCPLGCTNNTQCSANTPLCDRTGPIGVCAPCTDPDVTCPIGVCITLGTNQGQCGACDTSSDCVGTTPVCLPSTNTCVSCADPNATSMNVTCPANTMCDSATGACVPLAGCEDDSDCSSPTPTCDPNTRLCFGCGDAQITCQNGDLCDPDTGRCGLDPTQDADNDGILNGIECSALRNCPDTDGDGVADYVDPDDDGDSIPTSTECPNPLMCLDTDGDGTSNYLDTDDDGDTISTFDEVADGLVHGSDIDLDGVPNYLSTDSDRDGSTDRVEGRNNSPNSIPAYLDVNFLGGGGIAGGALRCSVGNGSRHPMGTLPFLMLALVCAGWVSRARGARFQ